MPWTVDEGFTVFHSRLTPTATESDAAKNHRASIEACLRSNCGMTHFFRMGSFGNATSIRSYSDVDYFACLPAERLHKDSTVSLAWVRNVLSTRFPNTNVHIDSPAVVIPFGTDASETTEVVPAYWLRTTQENFRVYGIPDKHAGWMSASPESHHAYVAYIDQQKGDRVRPLIRFLKAWKYYNGVPISSFYLELAVATYAAKEPVILYSIDVAQLFEIFWASQLAAVQDPMGISGAVTACNSAAERVKALAQLAHAVEWARKARAAEIAKNNELAFRYWPTVYAGCFPAYG